MLTLPHRDNSADSALNRGFSARR